PGRETPDGLLAIPRLLVDMGEPPPARHRVPPRGWLEPCCPRIHRCAARTIDTWPRSHADGAVLRWAIRRRWLTSRWLAPPLEIDREGRCARLRISRRALSLGFILALRSLSHASADWLRSIRVSVPVGGDPSGKAI